MMAAKITAFIFPDCIQKVTLVRMLSTINVVTPESDIYCASVMTVLSM